MSLTRALSTFLLLLLMAWSAPLARADHYSGGSLTYECIGNNFYRFNLDLYLDCNGQALTAQRLNFTNDCGVVFSVNNLPVTLAEEVSQLCPTAFPNSTCSGGAFLGLRHYRFQTTVFLSPCNDWSVSWGICCRNTTENLFGTPGMYLGTTVNNLFGVCDRSPAITDNSNPVVCVNDAVQYNPGIHDPDGHRMVFELIDAQFATPAPMPVVYRAGFSGTAPIPGIVLDPQTGQLSFTPTVTGNYVVVYKVTTYNSGGAMIGMIMRDFMVVVVNCAGEAPQTAGPSVVQGGGLVGPNELAVCHGVPVCVEFAYADADPGDLVTLTSNAVALLPGATFTVVGSNPAVGTLCWTPDIARPRTVIHVAAEDDECAYLNASSLGLLITVGPAPTVFPNAGTNGTLALCPNSPPSPLFDGLEGSPDPGGNWTFNGAAHGPTYSAGLDMPGVYTYRVVGSSPCASASATVTVLESENGLTLELENAANPSGVLWEVRNEDGTVVVDSGTNPFPPNSIGTQALCLADGCYRLIVTDPAGDGIVGYELREAGMNGRRIIDNTGNSVPGPSAIANGGTFCVPIGDISLIYSNCDKQDWVDNQYLVCHADANVSAQWQVGNQNDDGYNFWVFDANGSYSFRRFHTHAVSDGFSPASATRAARIKINGWSDGALTPHIPQGVLLNVRVRGVYNWNFTEWGPTCTMMIDPAAAACPQVWLQDDPANPDDFSCNVTRNFGGPNSNAIKITAKPPQFQPAPLAGGTGLRYQFRFRLPGENVCILRPAQASPTLYLNWSAASGPQLEASKTYEVEVRVSKDQGATWCVDAPSPACDPNPIMTWGRTCSVTIGAVNGLQGEGSSITTQGDHAFTLYPNPNKGEQIFISLTELGAEVSIVSVDIYDMSGKRVAARTIAVAEGFLNTALDLRGELANGVYLVNVTAGARVYNERLVIQK
jgi:hypothetical protein